MTTEKPPRIALILQPLPDSVPWPNRVRKALKSLLRTYGLKNVLFLAPETLEQDRSSWREVEPAGIQVPPVAKADACKDEPPF